MAYTTLNKMVTVFYQ